MNTRSGEVVFPEIRSACRGCGKPVDLRVDRDGLCTAGNCYRSFTEFMRRKQPDTLFPLYFSEKQWDSYISEWVENRAKK
jgi:hypothetical protein